MKKQYYDDPSQWGFMYDPPCGSHVDKVAELVLREAKKNPLVYGFVFNGVVVRVDVDGSAESIVAKYDQALAAAKR